MSERPSSASVRDVDLLVLGGPVLTMDDDDRVIPNGAVAVADGRIVAIDDRDELIARFRSRRTLDAGDHVLLPGLVDAYGHAGHGLVRGHFHPDHGWPAGNLYFEATTVGWWEAEAALAAAERMRFGVTTGQAIVGATPARMDDLAFTEATVRAYLESGLRLAVGVGPPDPVFPHLAEPWTVRREAMGVWTTHTYRYEETARGDAMKADGFVKVLINLDGEILGCHVVGPEASTLIQEVVVAMKAGSGTVRDIRDAVHIHPALPEVVQRAFSGQFSRGGADHQH